MGLLSEGSPLSWEETKKLADHVRKHGTAQFINQYYKLKERKWDCLLWGDEVEYNLVKLDKKTKKAQLLLKAGDILGILQEKEQTSPHDHPTTWRPEYASYMIEGTPGKPYGHMMAHFNMVEANMKLRREEVMKQLNIEDGEMPLSLTVYPRIGCPDFITPSFKPTPTEGASYSLFFPDEAVFAGHPRFKTLTRNIRERRGEKPAINMPIFKDKKTPAPFVEDLSPYGADEGSKRAALPGHIYMDCMGFGMGCSCLQMTFQACHLDEARHLYDQLAPLCPLFLALSAACPIQRGYLADTDCRWDIIAASVDCRTREERGLEPLKDNKFVIPKSRYDSIDSYLSPCSMNYNDLELVKDPEVYKQLRDAGIDHLLAQHIAHLFIRDPISLFSEKINQNDEEETDHFENLQSTNWQTMRFKPPPPNSDIGWRVEFRPTEVQLTDFENAAYTCFLVLLTRVILSFKLNFVIPISKVDSNMRRSQKRDAVLNQKFYFRKDPLTSGTLPDGSCENVMNGEINGEGMMNCSEYCDQDEAAEEEGSESGVKDSNCGCGRTESTSQDCSNEYIEMTANEIINGKAGEFPGLIPLIEKYLMSVDDLDVDTSCTIQQYLKLISQRAAGKLKTTARWMRDFVQAHPAYKQDSVVSEEVNFDLIEACVKVTQGSIDVPDLLPTYSTRSADDIPSAMQKAHDYYNNQAQTRKASLQTSEKKLPTN